MNTTSELEESQQLQSGQKADEGCHNRRTMSKQACACFCYDAKGSDDALPAVDSHFTACISSQSLSHVFARPQLKGAGIFIQPQPALMISCPLFKSSSAVAGLSDAPRQPCIGCAGCQNSPSPMTRHIRGPAVQK